jgi:hypothetical protein
MQKPTTDKQKKQKESKSKETGDTEKKKLLEAKIRKQVACEEKAFRVVERLIENPISEEFLIDAVYIFRILFQVIKSNLKLICILFYC